jgi:predicted DCC family thiol-disulfide oxidoreductase YuxK
VNTEITDNKKFNGWVLYDAQCRFCLRWAHRFQAPLASRHFTLLPLQTPWVKEQLALPDTELLMEMRWLRTDGTFLGGMDALLEVSRHFWWIYPFQLLGRLPMIHQCLHLGYRWIARRRYCADGACAIKKPTKKKSVQPFDLLPLLILPGLALFFRNQMADWVFMWTLAFALYAGCKWLTFREAKNHGARPGWKLSLGYLLAWPGMAAEEFFDRSQIPQKPSATEWIAALAKTALGAILFWGVSRTLLPAHPLFAGWVGMVSVVFIVHFGLFHLLSLAWRQAGIKAVPLMQNPLWAKSLSEFWGKRWNTAFHALAFRFAFRPLNRWTNPALATWLVFGLSGLIHDLVISVPARGGYGLPTLYFLIQGLGVLAERSPFGKSLGLGRGVRGWFFTLLVTAGPAFWLFHPPFVHNVILPMLNALGAT